MTFFAPHYTFGVMVHRITFVLLGLLLCVTLQSAATDNNVSHKAEVSIPEVALLALQFEGNSNVEIMGTTTTAGDKISVSEKSKTGVWVNYSSIAGNHQKRKITATVAGKIPEGIVLKVKADPYTGAGKGNVGTSTGLVQLSESPVDVISEIGSCYTGSGVQNGHLLSYQLELDEQLFYKDSEDTAPTLSIIYTLTDDN